MDNRRKDFHSFCSGYPDINKSEENCMKHIKKRIFMVSLLCFLVTITGCKKYDHEFKTDEKMSDILLLKTDETKENICMVTTGENQHYSSRIIHGRYIVLSDIEGGVKDAEVRYKKLFFNFYSLETKELVKTYSLKELEKGIPDVFCLGSGVSGFHNGGQDYLRIDTSYIGENIWQNTNFYLTINIDTDEMRFVDMNTYFDDLQEDSKRAGEYRNQLDIFYNWTQEPNRCHFMNINGFIPYGWEDNELSTMPFRCVTGRDTRGYEDKGIAEVSIATYALPNENKKLYGKFPELKQFQGQEGLIAKIFLANYPSPEEIMKLFLEDGHEISFEGCVMDGKYSIDGLPHEINSFDEFNQWIK